MPDIHHLHRHPGGPIMGNAYWTAQVLHHGITYFADSKMGCWKLRLDPEAAPLCDAPPKLSDALHAARRAEQRRLGEHVTDADGWERAA